MSRKIENYLSPAGQSMTLAVDVHGDTILTDAQFVAAVQEGGSEISISIVRDSVDISGVRGYLHRGPLSDLVLKLERLAHLEDALAEAHVRVLSMADTRKPEEA